MSLGNQGCWEDFYDHEWVRLKDGYTEDTGHRIYEYKWLCINCGTRSSNENEGPIRSYARSDSPHFDKLHSEEQELTKFYERQAKQKQLVELKEKLAKLEKELGIK